MRLEYAGHACFILTTRDGVVVMDPYIPGAFGGALRFRPLTVEPDLVLVSHAHADHHGVQELSGTPVVVERTGEISWKSLTIRGIPTFHDDRKGAERGPNRVYVVHAEGVRIAHAGDLGHRISEGDVGDVDVLLIPVGGHFTIDATTAWEVTRVLAPRVVIPMHYKTPDVDFPIQSVEGFLDHAEGEGVPIRRFPEGVVTFPPLPEKLEVWLLSPTHAQEANA